MSEIGNYKPNSYKSREEQTAKEEKKVNKVITGGVKTKKKNGFADVFISEDIHNVKSYIVMDVLVPAIKKAVSDVVRNGIDMILYGSGGRPSGNNGSKINYTKFSSDSRNDDRFSSNTTRLNAGYEDIILDYRADAEEVIRQMEAIIDEYGRASIGDLYDLVGKSTDNYMHQRYGWTNVRNADVIALRDGYLIKMPKAVPIK